ncbi:hypothetical protein KKHLCK_06590 [Candidatus Electrothrix laxa]
MSTPSLGSSLLRIWSSGQSPFIVGAGFVVTPEHAFTCAHVINSALGRDEKDQRKPHLPIFIDFLGSDNPIITATVLHWFPVCENSKINELEDIAVLKLNNPLPAEVCPASVEVSNNHLKQVKMCGFPTGSEDGTYLTGILQGPIKNGWVELHPEDGRKAAPGFSGTVAWDIEKNVACGMVVSRQICSTQIHNIYMIPADKLMWAFPEVENMHEVIPNYQEIMTLDKKKWFYSYRDCLPHIYKSLPLKKSSFWDIICHLANIPPQLNDDIPPLKHFIRKLGNVIRNDKLAEQLVYRGEDGFHDDISEPIQLLVHLIPDPNNRSNTSQEFKIHIYAWRNVSNCPKICEKNGCTQEEILGVIDQAIEGEGVNEEDEIAGIEFILPLEWIHLDVASLGRKEDFGWETRLVEYYRLMVRLDRYHYGLNKKFPRKFRDQWKRKWAEFQKIKNKKCDMKNHIKWVDDHKGFNAEYIGSEYLTDKKGKAFLAMTFFPEETSEVGKMILKSGIPVALWCNRSINNAEDHLMVKNAMCCHIFEGCKFSELIDKVHRVCKKEENKKRLEDHLALFWDDPERVPLTFGKSIDLE